MRSAAGGEGEGGAGVGEGEGEQGARVRVRRPEDGAVGEGVEGVGEALDGAVEIEPAQVVPAAPVCGRILPAERDAAAEGAGVIEEAIREEIGQRRALFAGRAAEPGAGDLDIAASGAGVCGGGAVGIGRGRHGVGGG
jgi:hypothetical protein